MNKDDPYGDIKTYHMGHLFARSGGGVSALCSGDKPKPINMRRATWTITPSQVTCPKCRKLLKEQGKLP